MVGSHHTKNLDPELRTGSTEHTQTAAKACKTDTAKLDSIYQIVSISRYQKFSEDKEEVGMR